MTALYVALAGAAGSLARYLLATSVQRGLGGGSRFPFGTFVVNVLGSLAIGFAIGLFAARGQLDSRLRIALTVGLLGGFTTYSAFALETVELLEARAWGTAVTYVMVTLVAAGTACALGLFAARALR